MRVLANPYEKGGQGENCYYYRGWGFSVRVHAVRPVHFAEHVPTNNGSGAGGPTLVSMPRVPGRHYSVRKKHGGAQTTISDGALRKANLKPKLAMCRFGEKNCAGTTKLCRGRETGPGESEGSERVPTVTNVQESRPSQVGEEHSRSGFVLSTVFSQISRSGETVNGSDDG